VPLFKEGEQVRCDYPVNGLRFGALYRVIAVRSKDPFYWGRCVEVRDIETGLQPPDNSAGFFPWRFSRLVPR
jgi:hypothetical protein